MADEIKHRVRVTRSLLCLLVVLVGAPRVVAQNDWSTKVLAQRDTDEKEVVVCENGGKGMPVETLSKLIARERHGPAVVAAAGMYFEKAEFDRSTPDLIRMIAKRPDIGAQAMAYLALSPLAPDLIVGLSKSKAKGDQQIAARLLAATEMMRSAGDRSKEHASAKIIGAKNERLYVDYQAEYTRLLGLTKDAVTLEYLLLAVGLDAAEEVKDLVVKQAASKDPAVAMAAQFALAALKQEIDEEAVLKAINRPDKHRKARPALSYDPRQTPRIYAIMAAGQAKLVSAREPLIKLLGDRDLHNAVYAARALNKIGGEGLAVEMLESIGEDTPWPVRVAVYEGVGLHPDKAAIELLRQRYNDETGRLRQDALYALLSIVAGKPEEKSIHSFDGWWAANGESFEVDKKASRLWRIKNKIISLMVDPIAGFYESAVISDRPVFAVDTSLSMKGPQIESLKQTLNDLVGSFPEGVKFNIVDFGGHVRTLAPGGMIPSRNRKAAMREFTYDLELTFGTRSYDAIERAMNIPGMDTVHFLSDGAPFGSHFKSWLRIEYVTRLYCQTVPVAVNMIYFPAPGKAAKGNVAMERYANANAGQFHVIQVKAPDKK